MVLRQGEREREKKREEHSKGSSLGWMEGWGWGGGTMDKGGVGWEKVKGGKRRQQSAA